MAEDQGFSMKASKFTESQIAFVLKQGEERRRLSSKSPVAKAIDHSLKRWPAFTRFLDDGRICMSNNAAERAIRDIAVGRRNWTFCGSESGGRRAAAIYTLIETCALNDVEARAWLADAWARIAGHPARQITDLLPGNWKAVDVAAVDTHAALIGSVD